MPSSVLVNLWRKTKHKLLVLKEKSPDSAGVAKVLGVMGTSWFSLGKFFDWSFHKNDEQEKGVEYDFATIASIILITFVLITTIVTRYFNMSRKNASLQKISALAEEEEEYEIFEDNIEEKEEKAKEIENENEVAALPFPATWLQPGIDPESYHVGYKATQWLAIYFMFCSGLSGFLSAFSLAKLVSLIPGVNLDTHCDETKSANIPLIIFLNSVAIYFAYASIQSFNKSNLLWMRDFYNTLVLEKKYRQLSKFSWAVTITGTAIGTMGIIFYNQNTYTILEEYSLCHVSEKAMMPNALKLLLSGISALSNIVVNGLLILGSMHNRYSATLELNQEQKIKSELSRNRLFNRLNPAIKLSMGGNTLTSSASTLIAIVGLPQSINKNFTSLNYNPGMIMLGAVCGLFTFWNQWALSNEAYLRELQARNKDLLPVTQSNNMINASEQIDRPKTAIVLSPIAKNTGNTHLNAGALKEEKTPTYATFFEPTKFKVMTLAQARATRLPAPVPVRTQPSRPWLDLQS